MDNLIEFAKEQCTIFPDDSEMGKYLRETLKMLQAEPCEDVPDTNVGNKMQAEHCEDSISREDVIKAIDRHTFNTYDGLCLDEDISIILEELPLVTPTQRWIPVSERLPDIHNYSAEYLTTVKGAGIHILSFTECAGKHWWAYKGVIAWMPLPEEYEADTDNEKLD